MRLENIMKKDSSRLQEDINRIKQVMGVSSIDESAHYRIFYDDNEVQRYAKVLNRAMNEYDWWKGIDIELLSYDERSNIINMSATLNVDEEWATKQWRFFNDEKPFQDYSIALSEIIDSNFANKLKDEFNNVFEFTFGLPSIVRSFNNIELNLIPTETIQEQEKPRKDLSNLIKQSLEPIIERKSDIICDVEITPPWNRESYYNVSYKVDVLVIGGPNSKYWPVTQAVRKKYDKIIDEVWDTIYSYFGQAVDVYIDTTNQCNKESKEEESEGVGAYAAPAFEMKPDHVHFKHQYNEKIKEDVNTKQEEPILNDSGEMYYIDWDENYGKSFKLVHTPEGAQSGVEWNPSIISVVTPENKRAWYTWKELSPKKLLKWKENWDDVQKSLGIYKYNQIVRNMPKRQEEMKEGLRDTFWANEKGDKVTLIDLLKATEDIPVEKISVQELKPKLLTWDDDEDEIKKIEKADLQYPILVFVDDDGEFISIIDGHHRAQKAVRKGLKTINTKMIPINSLPKNIIKIFGHLGKQKQNESELTEKCWKGYTQKGMKTLFGKRYPNCVKKKK